LAVGSALTLAASDRVQFAIARIGTMQVEGDAHLVLESTQGTRHRLSLDRGTVRVRAWAPPGSIAFQTPFGEVIDMGCEFDLVVSASRTTVHVRSGWIQLENDAAEVLVPAGATSDMDADHAPSVPVFRDAAAGFMTAVRALEDDQAENRPVALAAVTALARPRDVYTLLLLVERHAFGSDQLAGRAAELWPPPAGISVTDVVRGDHAALWLWRDTLPLPPPKGWLRNWRDALPEWLAVRPR
jgi:hypothetical protein